MAAVMYGTTGGVDDLSELKETEFISEALLQEFLARHPALLAGDQMNPTDPRRFVLVKAEVGIGKSRDSGDHFALDHLFIDQDGIPTLVEVKRSRDTRARREVIGQLLEYAANACAYWTVDKLRSEFEDRCERDGLNPQDELARLQVDPGTSVDDIWQKVAESLGRSELRLVFLADKFSAETQKIIEFLDSQMRTSEVFAVEVRQYANGAMKTLVPRLLNPSAIKAEARATAAGRGEPWTEQRFFSDLGKRHGNSAVAIFRDIYEWANSQPVLTTSFGRGNSDGSISVSATPGSVAIITLWTFGRVESERHLLYVACTRARDHLLVSVVEPGSEFFDDMAG